MERRLIDEYEARVETLLTGLRVDNLPLAAEIAALPLEIKGFGPVKLENATRVRKREALLVDRFLKGETDEAETTDRVELRVV